jgi:hypothetical protein
VGADRGVVSSGYAELAALAELELALALDGRAEELCDVHARRAALIASLPAVPPRSAEAHLRRAAVAQEQTTAALATAARAIRAQITHLERGRSAVAAYRPPAQPPAPRTAYRA